MTKENVLITGGYGFVGQNLCDYVLANPSWREKYHFMRFHSSKIDLMRESQVKACFDKFKPDYVIHLAAMCGGIGANQLYPAVFWDNNIVMSANIISTSAIAKIKKFITLGTVCSYGRNAKPPFTEEMLYTELPEITNRPYGVAKYAIYEGLRAFNVQYGMPFSYLIPTNMYGKHDNYGQQNSHVIPAIMIQMHDAKTRGLKSVTLWGDGTPTRDFLYAPDAAEALLACLDTDTGNQPMNIGTNEEISMGGLAEMMAIVTGYTGEILWDKTKPNGQPRRSVDWSKAKNTLFWEPKTKLMDGLKETYTWLCELPKEKPILPKTKPKTKPPEEE
jgi:nucleoside-diphosphate-sugar epimerase